MKKTITACCVSAFIVTAHGGEQATMSPAPMAPESASSGDFFFGANAREDAWYSYAGVNYALNGDKSTSGFILHAMGGYGGYEYDTLLGGVDADLTEFDLGLGYQWILPSHRLSLIGAYNYVDHDLDGDPIDIADNDVEGEESGFKAKLDIWNPDTTNYLYGGTFTYSTAYDSYWNRAVLAPRFGNIFLGPEVIVQGNEEYEEFRAGLTLCGLQCGALNVGASAGYAWADPKQGVRNQESAYGALHFSIDF